MTVTRQEKWDRRFLDVARLIATWSKDESTQVGSVIVDSRNTMVSAGYNGFPRGVNDDVPARHERPTKRSYFEHAERNAIYQNQGQSLVGCRIYVTHTPCADCARAIIQVQIAEVIVDKNGGVGSNWYAARHSDGYSASLEMFHETGVIYREV